jgi:pimeloyl-ACP methyl ester carboxylesterase
MKNLLLSFLARDWAGLVIAALVLGTGAALASGSGIQLPVLGWVLVLLGVLLALGSAWHLVYLSRVRAKHPPPGRLVDVGGFRMHVLAEGDARGQPPIVWFPGSHMGSFGYHHMHRVFREEARSILIDRPGTGWSGLGPFPRTTEREAHEVVRALEAAGERGPFVFVGHSFGGLLVANIARRYPQLVSTLVLLDPTPPDTIIYGPRLGSLRAMKRAAYLTLARYLFGLHDDWRTKAAMRRPDYAAIIERTRAVLGPEFETAHELEKKAATPCAEASIFEELSPEGMARAGWDLCVYDGDLEGVKVLLVAPRDMVEFENLPEAAAALEAGDAKAQEVRRMRRFFAASRERYLATSRLAERVYAPKGTGHNFPYEAAEFVADVVRRCLSGTTGA